MNILGLISQLIGIKTLRLTDTTSPCEPKASLDKFEKIERKSKTQTHY